MAHSHRLVVFSAFGYLIACSSAETGKPLNLDASSGLGAGGSATTGGTVGTGGAVATGGQVPATGGESAGGVKGSGGSPGTGGVPGTGGGMSTGGQVGSGGARGTGGVTGTGGVSGAGGVSGTGGVRGTGGATGTGGAKGTGGSPGTGGSSAVGDISITDPVPGFASVNGGTTGGGTAIGSAVTVNSMSALQSAAKGTTAAIILVEPGSYSGALTLGANKTIIGKGPGVTINGNIKISGSDVSNVIIRNLAVKGPPCSSYDECKAGSDAVYIGNDAHHVWLDHLDVADGQDGNCDITHGGDYITVSWTHFHYTYAKEHRFSNLIAGSDDEPDSVGKLHITYMNCHWGERVDQRQPRGRFGNIHMLNNYHNTGGSQIHGVGVDMALIAENCVYSEKISIWTDMGSPRGWKGIGNEGTASDLNASRGTVFTIPYSYTPLPASKVVAAVTSATCGAGNTCKWGS
jgi:pectate lyase